MEQRLQLTGVVDTETAVQLGKILGAKTLLLGNVDKFGGKYHVTARLVETETGEVISVAYEEISTSMR